VRRAFLCGEDTATGKNYDYRRQWLEDKLLSLAQIFAIKICSYAVMSNHYHIVLFIDKASADNWTNDEVIECWHSLFSGNILSQKYSRGETLTKAELNVLDEIVEKWRDRLKDISWYMRCLNENIARQANSEDDCTGRFWEGRYKCQALLDEAALAACMAYVDLNPIRAGIAKTPEQSDYTSVKRRIEKAQTAYAPNHPQQQPNTLEAFIGNPRKDMPTGLPFKLNDYLELIDWTGRIIHPNKRGAISEDLPTILDRLNIAPKHWEFMTQHFESRFKNFVGSAYKLKKVCNKLGFQRTPGLKPCADYFP